MGPGEKENGVPALHMWTLLQEERVQSEWKLLSGRGQF